MLAESSSHRDVHLRDGYWPAPPDPGSGRSYGPRHLEVMEGLEHIILTEGFRDLTVGVMAERLQCSRRTLYGIAPSKDEIVLVVVDRLLRRVARRSHDAVAREETSIGRLKAHLVTGLSELRLATVTFAEDVAAAPVIRDHVAKHFHYATGIGARMLAAGIEAGDFVDINPLLAAEVFSAGLARLQDPAVLRSLDMSLADALEQFLLLVAEGLCRPATRRLSRGRARST